MSSQRRRPSIKRRPARAAPPPRPPAGQPPTAGSVRSYHHGDLRAALLEAAHGLIQERGTAELSLREVARRAQVSHGAPAHHFGNKAGLLTAFAAQGFEGMTDAIAELERQSPAANGLERLRNTGRGYFRFAVTHPAHFALMFDTGSLNTEDPELVAASNRAYATVTSAVAECVSEGRLSAEEAPLAVMTAWSMVHGLATLWIGGRLRVRSGARAPEELGDRVIELFVRRLVGAAPQPAVPAK